MFYDRAEISGTARITKDGYFVADALVARADNIQDYLASEIGLTDRKPDDIVRVFRPAAEVFHKDALASLAHRPVTLDHPTTPVTAANWKTHAVGDVGDEVMRDGEFVRVPIKIMDADAITSLKSNRREFSLGYTAEMTPQTGVHDGQSYDFVAKNFRYNHLAAVARARGGESLRIIDERNPNTENTMKIKIGDAEVDATNGEAVRIAVDALNTKLSGFTADKAAFEAQIATLTTDKATLDAKVTTLEKQVADAKMTPAQLRDAARAFQIVADKAKAMGVTVSDEMDEPAIMRAVVSAKLGDAAKDWTDAQFAASFSTLTASIKDASSVVHNLNPAIQIGDAETEFAASQRKLSDQRRNAWKTPAPAAVA